MWYNTTQYRIIIHGYIKHANYSISLIVYLFTVPTTKGKKVYFNVLFLTDMQS